MDKSFIPSVSDDLVAAKKAAMSAVSAVESAIEEAVVDGIVALIAHINDLAEEGDGKALEVDVISVTFPDPYTGKLDGFYLPVDTRWCAVVSFIRGPKPLKFYASSYSNTYVLTHDGQWGDVRPMSLKGMDLLTLRGIILSNGKTPTPEGDLQAAPTVDGKKKPSDRRRRKRPSRAKTASPLSSRTPGRNRDQKVGK